MIDRLCHNRKSEFDRICSDYGQAMLVLATGNTKHVTQLFNFKIRSKENLKEVDVSDEIIDKQMTKYRNIEEEGVQNVSTAVSPYRLQFVTRKQDHQHDDLAWLYDTPGLYSKNQVGQNILHTPL